MRLSLLDRTRTRAGLPEVAALPHSVERAVVAEAAGYHRFWVAEHHAVPGIASGSPAVLLAAISARTARIRLGSGGVMLPNHRPLVVAEQFLMLEALAPGRVDLGLGRSLGFTAPVREALGRHEASAEEFAREVAEVRAHLEGRAPVTAHPAAPARDAPRPAPHPAGRAPHPAGRAPSAGSPVPVHLLATGSGLELAARLGLPVVVGGPVLRSPELPTRLAAYRRSFRPHRGSAPHVMLSADVLVADTDAEARELALPEAWALVRSRRTGIFGPLEPIAAIREEPMTSQERQRLEDALDQTWAGSAGSVAARIGRLMEETGADELLVSGVTTDREALADSDRRLAELLA